MKKRNIIKKRFVTSVLVLAMVFSFIPVNMVSADTSDDFEIETPVVVVTGSDIIGNSYNSVRIDNEKAYTLDELKDIDNESPYKYSSIDSSGIERLHLANGVKISQLLEIADVDNTTEQAITSASKGGRETQVSIFGSPRYYYPDVINADESDSIETPAILSWAQANAKAPEIPTTSGIEEKTDLLMMIGQTNVTEKNYPLFNDEVNKIRLGSEIEEVALTIDSNSYTRAEILLMPRTIKTYDGTTVQGIPMKELLKEKKNSDEIVFTTVDGTQKKLRKSKLVSNNYMLAYAQGTDENNLEGIFGTSAESPSKNGFLTLYGEGADPLELVDSFTVEDRIDFSNSPYKHITNGGNPDAIVKNYNIDAITSATVTVEGPAVEQSVPISVRELESNDDSLYRGTYEDSTGSASYEGVDLAYLLTEMTEGDSGIILTDEAKKVQLKDINRKTVATLSIEDIIKASQDGNPVILAYGIGKEDRVAPFVFTHALADEGQHNPGYVSALDNEDGCMKLVFDLEKIDIGTGEEYNKFTNAAYVYIMADNEPGYKHDSPPYNSSRLKDYTIAFTGKSLGREVNLTTEQIEGLSSVSDLGYKKEYSLANNNYWYVNEYEGIKLWELLNHLGIPSADGTNTKKSTKVTFTATDGYVSADSFTYEELANPDLFGYYEKNPDDLDDGKYEPKPDDLKASGYPVLLAYGVNRYPYVIDDSDEGFMSGLSNDGGPMRVIFGKRNYNHANGSSQIQQLNYVNIGSDEFKYNTHKYHDSSNSTGAAYKALADNTLNVTVKDGDTPIKNKNYSVGDIEDLIYAPNLGFYLKDAAKSKDFYETVEGGATQSDLYEGVDLEYFIWDVLEIPGLKGDITFTDTEGQELTVELEDLKKKGVNTNTGQADLKPVLAFAKNGAPLVTSQASVGYEDKYEVANGITMDVGNDGGPLSVLFPTDDKNDISKIKSLTNVASIEIDLEADQYAHVKDPYADYKDNVLTISGAGTLLSDPKEFKIEELESKQTLAVTGDYNIKNDSEDKQLRYRGISLYDFLNSGAVGLRVNADKVNIKSSNGDSIELSMADIMKKDYINSQDSDVKDLEIILAYGSAPVAETDKEKGLPLVATNESAGYDASHDNQGGPLKLVVGQKSTSDKNNERILNDVVGIEITASEMDSWKHSVNDIYSQYLDYEFELVIKNSDNQSTKKFTLKELEDMDDLIVRDEYIVSENSQHEGLDMWKFVKKVAGDLPGLSNPVSVRGYSDDGYSMELLSSFGIDQFEKGVLDGFGKRKPIIMAYATNGYPLVPNSKSAGYVSIGKGNASGPLRLYTENTTGTCMKYLKKIEVTLPGGGPIVIPDPESDFKFLSSGEGGELPEGASVRCVTVNDNKDMWVGTYNAGAYFKPKNSDKITINTVNTTGYALKNKVVTAIAEDDEGGLWFTQAESYDSTSTNNKGVAYVKDGQIKYYDTVNNPGTIPHDYVQEIKIDSKGNVWFGSFGGLTKYDPAQRIWQTWTKQDGLPAESVNRIVIEDDDNIWVGCYPDTDSSGNEDTFIGGYCLVGSDGNIKSTYTSPADASDGEIENLADSWIRDIALDDNGGKWIVRSGSYPNRANVGGRIDYIDANGKVTHYTGVQLLGDKLRNNSEVRALDVDRAGNLWLGAWNGVFVLDTDMNFIKEYSYSAGSWENPNMNSIYSLNIINNILYIGSAGGVAYKENIAADPATILDRLEITSKPNKTVYVEGEKFDKTGMRITAHFRDGSKNEVGAYTVDKTTLKYGDTSVTISYGGKTVKLDITVNKASTSKAKPVKSVKTSKTIYVVKGSKVKLPLLVSPSDATNKSVTWSSKNKKIATVTKNGTVKGIKKGTTKITVKSKDSGKSATCKVVVVNKKAAPKKLTVKPSKKITLKVGKTKQIKTKIAPKKATGVVIKYKSSNKKVATVDAFGKITAKKKGTAKITVTAGKLKKKITVKVKK